MIFLLFAIGCGSAKEDTASPDTAQAVDTADTLDTAVSTETQEPEELLFLLQDQGSASVEQEVLAEEVDSAWFMDDMILIQKGEELLLRNIQSNTWESLYAVPDAPILQFGISPSEDIILTTEDAIWVLDGLQVRQSPLHESFSSTITHLYQDDQSLWLQTAEGFFQWKNGFIREILVEDTHIEGAALAGTMKNRKPTIWVGAEEGVVEYTINGMYLEADSFLEDIQPQSIVSTDQAQWMFIDDQTSYRFDGEKRRISGVESIQQLSAHPQNSILWFMDGAGGISFLHEQDVFSTGLGGVIIGTDSAGRLLLLHEGQLQRIAPERRVVLRNTPSLILEQAQQLFIDPMFREAVLSMTVSIDEEEIELLDSSFEILPNTLEGGAHFVHVVVEYESTSIERDISFVVAGDTINWDDHISPLSVDNCLRCHAGGTNTELHTKDLWIEKIDKILLNVSNGTMPIGASPLTTEQISLIEAWQASGFQ